MKSKLDNVYLSSLLDGANDEIITKAIFESIINFIKILKQYKLCTRFKEFNTKIYDKTIVLRTETTIWYNKDVYDEMIIIVDGGHVNAWLINISHPLDSVLIIESKKFSESAHIIGKIISANIVYSRYNL